MRIFSKFHDYYDIALRYGIDSTILYKREEEEIEHITDTINLLMKFVGNGYFGRDRKNYMYQSIIGFCGKWYLVVETEEHSFYSYEDLKDIKLENKIYVPWNSESKFNKKNLFNEISKINDVESFIINKTPIITIVENFDRGKFHKVVYKNSCLKDFNFQKIKDPYTAFQEISMFISGVLGQEDKETIQISDEDMRDKKGFDSKSFKTVISKKPRRKNRNK
jgi:hypothetical protein